MKISIKLRAFSDWLSSVATVGGGGHRGLMGREGGGRVWATVGWGGGGGGNSGGGANNGGVFNL